MASRKGSEDAKAFREVIIMDFFSPNWRGSTQEVEMLVAIYMHPDVDFLVKTGAKSLVIEVTESTRRQKLESMSYRAFKIKQTLRNTTVIGIFPDNLTEALKRRLEDFDAILMFSDIEFLEKKLQLTPQAAV